MSGNLSSNTRIAKNTIFLYGRLIFTMIISLYTTRVVLNVLGVVDFGIYNVVCGFVAMFSFLNTTMSNGIQRFYNYEAGKNGIKAVTKVYQTAMQIQVVLVLLLLLIIEPLGIWYINNEMIIPSERLFAANWIFQFSLFSLICIVFQVPFSAAIMAHEKMDYYATIGILDAFFKLAIVIVLPFIGGDCLIIYGLLLFSISMLNLIFYAVYALRNFQELKLSKVFHRDLFKNIFNFTGWNLVEMFAWTTQGQGVNMVMNLFCGPVVNAAQGIAVQISSALSSFCANLSIAFRPQLVHSYAAGDYDRTNIMFFVMSKAMFTLMTLMVVPLSLEMQFILNLWLGDVIPQYTLQFAVLVMLSMLPRNMTMAISQIIHASGKMKTYQLGSAVVIFSVLPMSYILLKFGLSPVYIYSCSIIIFCALWIVDLFLLKRVFNYSITRYFRLVVIPCLFLLIGSYSVPYLIHLNMEEGMIRFMVVSLLSLITTILFSYLLLLSRSEKLIAKSFIIKKIRH